MTALISLVFSVQRWAKEYPTGRLDVRGMFGGQRLTARSRKPNDVGAVGTFVSDTQGAAPKAPLLRKS